ncbi:MAG TPA: XRE family transcriptional regulator [Helicobacteraceae bacterium]|nr:XRE family transcriptional regulator [Helicobacteraceae bacterium]
MKKNKKLFSGSRSFLGEKKVLFNNHILDPRFDLFNHARDGFDWGYMGSGAMQLAFAILKTEEDELFCKQHCMTYAKEVISQLPKKEWELSNEDVRSWIHSISSDKNDKENIVKSICKELKITQKRLAQILEIPEGTVSSWAVKNEIPRLGKKAIEFYIEKQKYEEIVVRFKEVIELVKE